MSKRTQALKLAIGASLILGSKAASAGALVSYSSHFCVSEQASNPLDFYSSFSLAQANLRDGGRIVCPLLGYSTDENNAIEDVQLVTRDDAYDSVRLRVYDDEGYRVGTYAPDTTNTNWTLGVTTHTWGEIPFGYDQYAVLRIESSSPNFRVYSYQAVWQFDINDFPL